MSFSNLPAVQLYINSYINTNGTNSITGVELNTALTGMLQFIPIVGNYSTTLSSGQTTVTIPLTFTPLVTIVQILAEDILDLVVTSTPTTNGIIVTLINRKSIDSNYTFSYLAI